MTFRGSSGSGSSWPARISATWLELPVTGFWWQLTQLVALYTGPSPSEIASTSSNFWRSLSKASWASNPLVELLKPVGASSGLSVASCWGAAWDPFAGLLGSTPTDTASIKAGLQMPRAHTSSLTVLGNSRRFKARLNMLPPPQASSGNARNQSASATARCSRFSPRFTKADLTPDVRAVGRGRHGFGRPNSWYPNPGHP